MNHYQYRVLCHFNGRGPLRRADLYRMHIDEPRQKPVSGFLNRVSQTVLRVRNYPHLTGELESRLCELIARGFLTVVPHRDDPLCDLFALTGDGRDWLGNEPEMRRAL